MVIPLRTIGFKGFIRWREKKKDIKGFILFKKRGKAKQEHRIFFIFEKHKNIELEYKISFLIIFSNSTMRMTLIDPHGADL